ncbi:hypothetical protein, variant [Verruconis gallopava]|uniref:BZIP domain-containing protein n=1 Tax=Verruconis gallopava TaxID=253628 RepID=A0A0D2ALR6_9PEZI|nr:hypothetical protein, variant [Verruconis gallopava]KIW07713.1 hypothetical protein, variant [Verruconis gallopava]
MSAIGGSNGSDTYDQDGLSKSQSPLERLGFKLHIGDKKTRDGQVPKRRGPKPDSKPALTRRQELNRQAQRTHRERKELYIKALEQEVLRLKELYEQSVKEKQQVVEENQALREALRAYGIQYDPRVAPYNTASSQYGESTASITNSQTRASMSTGVTSPTPPGPSIPNPSSQGSPPTLEGAMISAPHGYQTSPQQQNFDHNQVGIDFVLTLEKPCQDHMQMLLVRSEDSDGEISGHVLMATCPPHSHILDKPEEKYPHKVSDLPGAELEKLLNLSAQLPIAECELPPVRAWAMIRNHPRFTELTKEECEALRDELAPKIRCYGFGAVLEDFEVRDAIAKIMANKREYDHDPSQMDIEWNSSPDLEAFQG